MALDDRSAANTEFDTFPVLREALWLLLGGGLDDAGKDKWLAWRLERNYSTPAEEALDAMREERIDDMAAWASLAVACIHVVDGTEDPAEFEGYSWPGEPEDESDCICTPEQRELGGFMGRCPVHGYGLRMEVRRACNA